VKAASQYFNEFLKQNMAANLTGNMMTGENAQFRLKIAIADAVDRAVQTATANGDMNNVKVTTDDLIARNLAKTQWATQGLTPYSGEQAQAKAIQDAGREAIARSTVVNIHLGGVRTPVNVASPADADALVGIFKQLEADSRRTF
jgi:hypothetical protein